MLTCLLTLVTCYIRNCDFSNEKTSSRFRTLEACQNFPIFHYVIYSVGPGLTPWSGNCWGKFKIEKISIDPAAFPKHATFVIPPLVQYPVENLFWIHSTDYDVYMWCVSGNPVEYLCSDLILKLLGGS